MGGERNAQKVGMVGKKVDTEKVGGPDVTQKEEAMIEESGQEVGVLVA